MMSWVVVDGWIVQIPDIEMKMVNETNLVGKLNH